VVDLQAPVGFFDVTPVGRILNRFSSDVFSVDDTLPFILNIFLAQAFSLLGVVVICCYGLPYIALLIAPLTVLYYFIQVSCCCMSYLLTSVDTVRCHMMSSMTVRFMPQSSITPYFSLATSEMWCWSGGRRILTEMSLCYSIVYCNGAQWNKQVLQVDWLDWALVLLGLAHSLLSTSVSWIFTVLYIFNFYVIFFSLPFSELSLVCFALLYAHCCMCYDTIGLVVWLINRLRNDL